MKTLSNRCHLRALGFAVALCPALLLTAWAQNPAGPEQPPLAEGQPEIEITSKKGLRVVPDPNDPNKTVIEYLGGVNLVHHGQGLDLECDRLEVHFNNQPANPSAEESQADAAEPTNGDGTAATDGSEGDGSAAAGGGFGLAGSSGGNIEEIIATGNVVIVKDAADGKQSIARCGQAQYYPDSGDVYLTLAPEIQDDRRRVRAQGQEGVITLRENGEHSAEDGEFETILLNGAGGGGASGARGR